MKRSNLTPIIMLMAFAPMIALAGDGGIPDIVQWLLVAAALVIGVFIPAPHVNKFQIIKQGVLTAVKMLDKILEAKHKDSEGGKKITEAEWKEIYGQLEGVAEILRQLVGKK